MKAKLHFEPGLHDVGNGSVRIKHVPSASGCVVFSRCPRRHKQRKLNGGRTEREEKGSLPFLLSPLPAVELTLVSTRCHGHIERNTSPWTSTPYVACKNHDKSNVHSPHLMHMW